MGWGVVSTCAPLRAPLPLPPHLPPSTGCSLRLEYTHKRRQGEPRPGGHSPRRVLAPARWRGPKAFAVD